MPIDPTFMPSLCTIYEGAGGVRGDPREEGVECNLVPRLQQPTLEQLGSFKTGWTHYIIVPPTQDIRDDQAGQGPHEAGPACDWVEVDSQPGTYYKVIWVTDAFLDTPMRYRKAYLWRQPANWPLG